MCDMSLINQYYNKILAIIVSHYLSSILQQSIEYILTCIWYQSLTNLSVYFIYFINVRCSSFSLINLHCTCIHYFVHMIIMIFHSFLILSLFFLSWMSDYKGLGWGWGWKGDKKKNNQPNLYLLVRWVCKDTLKPWLLVFLKQIKTILFSPSFTLCKVRMPETQGFVKLLKELNVLFKCIEHWNIKRFPSLKYKNPIVSIMLIIFFTCCNY